MSTFTSLASLSRSPNYQTGTCDLPLLNELAIRYADERPFAGLRVVWGHVLVFNSIAAARVLAIGGAEVTFCDPFPSPVTQRVMQQLEACGIPVLPMEKAVYTADLFLDVTAVLGQHRLPSGAAEISRSGDLFYENQACVTVSIDGAQVKKIECFFGTGDGMVRAWQLLNSSMPLAGLQVVQFGYGKVGRGVAWRLRQEQVRVTVVELPGINRDLAMLEGFDTVLASEDLILETSIAKADVILAATGVPNAVAHSVPVAWLNFSQPVLVSLSAVDEFGDEIASERILGGKGKPLNFHLESPTANRYVDPSLTGHLLALEEVVRGGTALKPGLNLLSEESDLWLLSRWRHHWPNEVVDSAFQTSGV